MFTDLSTDNSAFNASVVAIKHNSKEVFCVVHLKKKLWINLKWLREAS